LFFVFCFFLFNRRGRPTSVILLLLVVVPQLALALRGHPPLGLHDLLRLAGTLRLVVAALRGVEVLQVGRRTAGCGCRTGTGWGRRTGRTAVQARITSELAD
jgi:hypothetical protein